MKRHLQPVIDDPYSIDLTWYYGKMLHTPKYMYSYHQYLIFVADSILYMCSTAQKHIHRKMN